MPLCRICIWRFRFYFVLYCWKRNEHSCMKLCWNLMFLKTLKGNLMFLPVFNEIVIRSEQLSPTSVTRVSYERQKSKQKSPGRATSRSRSQPPTPGGREKVRQINVCIANKQMHDNHKDQLPLPQARLSKC